MALAYFEAEAGEQGRLIADSVHVSQFSNLPRPLAVLAASVGFSGTVWYTPGQEARAMKEQLTAVFQQVPEGYIAFVEELPGANTQGDTLEEARANLHEAVQLVLEANRALAEEVLRNKTVIREPLASIS